MIGYNLLKGLLHFSYIITILIYTRNRYYGIYLCTHTLPDCSANFLRINLGFCILGKNR